MKKSLTAFAPLLIAFMLGIVAYAALDWRHHLGCRENYAYINVDEFCSGGPAIEKTGYAKTQGEIEEYIASEKALGNILEASLYFRDLEDGPVFGIDETNDFAPASLLKLPLSLVYLSQAERHPELLGERLAVMKPQWSFSPHFAPSEEIDPREPHTVDELLMHMLVHSDNNAYGVLQTHLFESGQENLITQTFLELGFLDPNDIYDEVLSTRRYASIFRALYNVSYINAPLSEKILEWLARSDFSDGLVAGVPKGIPVAHKFGERVEESGAKQLHDCGIIYFPKNPYVLCVMTRGADFDDLVKIIRHISEIVYREVESRRL